MTSTATATKPPTYRKTKTGEWVVFGSASVLTAGRTVNVAKKDGSVKVETIARVGRPFTVDGVDMVYGYIAKTEARPAARRSESHYVATPDCGHRHYVAGCFLCQHGIGY